MNEQVQTTGEDGMDTHMRSREVLHLHQHGFHRIHYTEWGAADSGRVAICSHGLTRNARDFDFLAADLARRWRVLCPDMPGRGGSDRVPASAYGYPLYCAAAATVIARSGADRVDWVGTSMGGLIGMMLAAQPRSPIRRLVVNDVGPLIPAPALRRIGEYLRAQGGMRFTDLDAVERHLREVYAPFGALSDGQWCHLARHSARDSGEGDYVLHYDPAIADAFEEALRESGDEPVDLWSFWDAIRCPVLVIRGADSDVLPADIAADMARRGPKARVEEIEGCGHAPALMDPDQIELVSSWLAD